MGNAWHSKGLEPRNMHVFTAWVWGLCLLQPPEIQPPETVYLHIWGILAGPAVGDLSTYGLIAVVSGTQPWVNQVTQGGGLIYCSFLEQTPGQTGVGTEPAQLKRLILSV